MKATDPMPEQTPSAVKNNFKYPGHRHTRLPAGRGRQITANCLQGLFVALLIYLLVFYRDHPLFQTLSITFVSIVLEAFPFMLLGALLGGFIEVFIPRERITALLPDRKWLTILLAAASGLLFPVCECAIVPIIRRLLQKGVPLGAAVAFMLGGPIVNPLVAASTAVAYNFTWSIVVQRLVLGYLIAVTAGLLIELIFTRQNATIQPKAAAQASAICSTGVSTQQRHPSPMGWRKVSLAAGHAAEDFFDIGRYLVIGAFFAGLLQTAVPRTIFVTLVDAPYLAILAMMVMAVLMNLCSEADAFVAASFRALLPLNSQMAFMVLGPMLDIKLIVMYLGVFRKRAIVALAGITFGLVFLAMVIMELIG